MTSPHSSPRESPSTLSRLRETQRAFDSVAPDYDGARGNNASIQDMRAAMWRTLDATFAPGSCLIDLGCGTGLDAVRMARAGYNVTASDWSPRMIERTRERAEQTQLAHHVSTLTVGAHELSRIAEAGQFDGAYSNLGALNCVPDLAAMAAECARLLKPHGILVFAVIGRICPWEIGHYALKGNWRRLNVRFARDMVPVSMNKQVVWTRYYTPREFYRAFERHFTLQSWRGLCLFAPPPYLSGLRDRHFHWYRRLWGLDQRAAAWPLLRNMGDHFLTIMRKR